MIEEVEDEDFIELVLLGGGGGGLFPLFKVA